MHAKLKEIDRERKRKKGEKERQLDEARAQ